jgi:hypothetical protein
MGHLWHGLPLHLGGGVCVGGGPSTSYLTSIRYYHRPTSAQLRPQSLHIVDPLKTPWTTSDGGVSVAGEKKTSRGGGGCGLRVVE